MQGLRITAANARIGTRILTALEVLIPLHEAALARLMVSENFDAWSACHLGLQHMYRFNRRDNAVATGAERAARSPGAHVLIAMIAATAHGLAGDDARAAAWAANVRARSPALTREDFYRAFPMQRQGVRERVANVLARSGLR